MRASHQQLPARCAGVCQLYTGLGFVQHGIVHGAIWTRHGVEGRIQHLRIVGYLPRGIRVTNSCSHVHTSVPLLLPASKSSKGQTLRFCKVMTPTLGALLR